MKKLLILLLLAFALPTYAHVIQKDGYFEGMMHILPDDNPAAGTTTSIYFMFDRDKKVVTSCDCTVSVLKDEKVLYTEQIRNKFSFYFPKIGIYTVTLAGKDFNLNWDIRIDRDVRTYTKYYIIAFGVIALVLGVILLKRRRSN